MDGSGRADEAEARGPGPALRLSAGALDVARTFGDSNRLCVPDAERQVDRATSTLLKMLQHQEVAAVSHGLRSSLGDVGG